MTTTMMHPDGLVSLSVLAFVLGAVLTGCLLFFFSRYGFARGTDSPARLGHAIAAALFGTGVVFAVLALTAVPLGGVERYRDLLDRLRERVDRVRTGLVAVEGVVESLGQRTERALRAILPAQPSAVPAPGPLASSPLREMPAARTGGDSVAVGPTKLGPEGSSSVIASPPAAPGGRPVRSVPLAARVAPPERRQDSVHMLDPERLQPPTSTPAGVPERRNGVATDTERQARPAHAFDRRHRKADKPVGAHLDRARRREISEDSVPGAKPRVDRERDSAGRADHAAAAGSPRNVERAALPGQGVQRHRDDLLDTRPGLDRPRPEEPREHPSRGGRPGRAEHAEALEPAGRTERSERIERAERPERVERPERLERDERAERPERLERTERLERIERTERPERIERTERPERVERVERPERIERTERPERIERAERPERTERPERVERVERVVERLDRIERLERRGR